MAVAGVQNRAGGVWGREGGVVRYGGRQLGPQVGVTIGGWIPRAKKDIVFIGLTDVLRLV
jgi:hypothetical protein